MAAGYLKGRRIALGVGGGIAAYKACDLVRELRRAGATVRVSMTPSAQKFVSALTFQSLSGNPVLTDVLEPAQDSAFGHLHLSRWADVFVIAPATADLIARIHAGMANDAVTTALIAFKGPVLLVPAMNTAMWENARTQQNVAELLKEPRYRTVGPESGLLADGDVGAGRLAALPAMVEAVAALQEAGPLYGKSVLVTAGPTREHFDPVRYLSNPSTGKMGLAIAEEARARGAEVTVVLGPVGKVETDGLEVVPVTSADEMSAAVMQRLEGLDYFVAAAAVSDWKPAEKSAQKKKKSDGPEALTLVRTPDVLLDVSTKVRGAAKRPVLIGFAAETERVVENAREKLGKKALDFIVANDVTEPGAGFAAETNRVVVVSAQGAEVTAEGTKREVAARIWDLVGL